jgi:hypothetical protein
MSTDIPYVPKITRHRIVTDAERNPEAAAERPREPSQAIRDAMLAGRRSEARMLEKKLHLVPPVRSASQPKSSAEGFRVDIEDPYYGANEKIRLTVCARDGSTTLLLSRAAALTLSADLAHAAHSIEAGAE